MSASDTISIIALTVSILSLILTGYFNFLDRVKIEAKCKYHAAHPDYDRERIVVTITNKGRRTAIIKLFGGYLKGGSWCGEHLDYKSGGMRLGENEAHEITLYKEDLLNTFPDGTADFYRTLFFEDSLGKRHIVKSSVQCLNYILR